MKLRVPYCPQSLVMNVKDQARKGGHHQAALMTPGLFREAVALTNGIRMHDETDLIGESISKNPLDTETQ